jgi:hypothetical protein
MTTNLAASRSVEQVRARRIATCLPVRARRLAKAEVRARRIATCLPVRTQDGPPQTEN